jgi:phage shock protein PspC (stress-responsive transcriptional regulator)
MGAKLHMRVKRPDGALLAGVCAGIARALGWNVWVLRALFIGFLADWRHRSYQNEANE